MFYLLFHNHHKIFANAPESCGIGDAKCVHSSCIFVKRIGTCGMVGEKLRAFRIEFYYFVNSYVYFREVVFVEIISF